MGLIQTFGAFVGISGLLSGVMADPFNGTPPQSYGILFFPAFDVIDVYGPLEVLQSLGSLHHIEVSFIAETLEPVSSERLMVDKLNSTGFPSLTPTHTIHDSPELDVMIVVGGPGMTSNNLNATIDFIREKTPQVKQLITICTGSGLAARSGVLDGKMATTHKTSWPDIITYGPNTTWLPDKRWVEDESGSPPIWSSSGVSSGLDLMLHFVETYYSLENATFVSKMLEYVRHTDPNDDPFAYNGTLSARNCRRDRN
ncbi:class I glutamine amidotransferase-like protein [Pleomassaria siparia CBS 279.74]|uniref:Class I glutamine amidotransferase-like protein n=1 Tax=Pleomassaria siparia CBS 279.74 TaxID=1314801 RepID=A0A6G1JSA9_9PLEO|nr:class I glutamine amidotransferase-like protein [Pleomassaria siparia CBS 279.74]